MVHGHQRYIFIAEHSVQNIEHEKLTRKEPEQRLCERSNFTLVHDAPGEQHDAGVIPESEVIVTVRLIYLSRFARHPAVDGDAPVSDRKAKVRPWKRGVDPRHLPADSFSSGPHSLFSECDAVHWVGG